MPGFEAPVEYLTWATQDDIRRIQTKLNELSKELESRIREMDTLKRALSNEIAKAKTDLNESTKRLEELTNRIERIKQEIETIKAALVLGRMVGEWKEMTCQYAQQGVCTAWRLGPEVIEAIKKNFGAESITTLDGVERIRVSKVSTLCAYCPLYRPRRKIEEEHSKHQSST